ncbi:MAG TPA: zinc ribbon domain-containing protein [Bryobacteraceae bacterium]|nr:zinc ribbon domain-containing protein [Bryobacteraceae bacterium]
MSAPFCTGCGATVAAGTRFCVKCGQPVGQAAPPPAAAGFPTVAPPAPPPPPASPVPPWSAQFPSARDAAGPYPAPPPAKQGSGIGVRIGLLGVLLLIGGAGLWFYTTHGGGFPGFHAAPAVQVAAQPVAAQPVAAPAPAPSTAPEVPPPNPDSAKPDVPPSNPDSAKPQNPPPNPDFSKKDRVPAPAVDRPVRSAPARPRPADPAPPPQPAPTKPAVTRPTTGTLHATVEVAQNGEVVFENLPVGRLRFIYDHAAWQPTIHRQTNGTQTLVMRSLKAGIQRSCDVQWEIVQ